MENVNVNQKMLDLIELTDTKTESVITSVAQVMSEYYKLILNLKKFQKDSCQIEFLWFNCLYFKGTTCRAPYGKHP